LFHHTLVVSLVYIVKEENNGQVEVLK